MSFVIQVSRFCSVRVEQEGSALPLESLSFAPTGATVKKLADHKMIIKPRMAGFDLFYSKNPLASPPLLGAITGPVHFTFAMLLSRLDLLEKYEPDLTPASGAQLYLDNLNSAGNILAGNPVVLSSGAVAAVGDGARVTLPVFSATTALAAPLPTKFQVFKKFAPATLVQETPIVPVAGAAQASATINLANSPPGPYLLKTDAAGAPSQTIYVDEEVAGMRPFGVFDLHWNSAQDGVPPGGLSFVLRFRLR